MNGVICYMVNNCLQAKTVAILLATYNGEKYLKEQLDSILSQTYKNFKIIVSDDGSTDKTRNILVQYEKEYPSKIRLLLDHALFHSARDNFFICYRILMMLIIICSLTKMMFGIMTK